MSQKHHIDFGQIFSLALKDAFVKLDPRVQWKNPVMFVTYIGALLTTYYALRHWGTSLFGFEIQISVWLWFTVLFANFAEAISEGRGKAQANALKKTRSQTIARKWVGHGEQKVSASELQVGDRVVCEGGDVIPADGEVIEGIATVDESAVTGESAPVIRESGGDRSAVTGGTRVISDRIVIQVTAGIGHSFLDRMIGLVEGAKRQKTPNEIALSLLLSALTLIFLAVIVSLKFFSDFSMLAAGQDLSHMVSVPVFIALLVCLIPTTIGGLLSAIGISGMDRLIQRNVIAMSGRAIEAAGDIDLLLLDKTGTITLGNRMATEFYPAPGCPIEQLAKMSQLASLSDETPEGRTIVILAKEKFNLRASEFLPEKVQFIPFSAQTQMSGIDIRTSEAVEKIRKGSLKAIEKFVQEQNGLMPREVISTAEEISKKGGTPLVVAQGKEVLGIIQLKDVVKGGIRERFHELRSIGIRTIMITGDNELTAAAIAAEAGVDDFMAQATPEEKLKRIRQEQAHGHLVAMTGDGTNDAPALAQADVGVAMNTGTQAAREAGNMVDLDSNPTKLIEIIEIGKQLLMTRGALTTFSVANDVAKYFAILPALFGTLYGTTTEGPLNVLNIMKLSSPQNAILSAVIFNAMIMVLLIPLALRGVKYKPALPWVILRNNVFRYGVGGLMAPFLGMKVIDLILSGLKVNG